jgi:hypothetical protein
MNLYAFSKPGCESSPSPSLAVTGMQRHCVSGYSEIQHGGQKPKVVVTLERVLISKRLQRLHPHCLPSNLHGRRQTMAASYIDPCTIIIVTNDWRSMIRYDEAADSCRRRNLRVAMSRTALESLSRRVHWAGLPATYCGTSGGPQ